MKEAESPDDHALGATRRLHLLLNAALNEEAGTFINGVTSAAFVDLLRIAKELGEIKKAESYEISSPTRQEAGYRYEVGLKFPDMDLEATVNMAEVKGTWMIAAIKIPGIRE